MLRRLFTSLLLVISLASCDEEARRPVTIDLSGRVGDRPFECGAAYEGIGTTSTTFTALDFRFYVHDVRVVIDGEEVAVRLDDDGVWQDGGIALIDFEDGDGCDGGNAPTNTRLVGSIPERAGEITGVRFRVGVPEARNHLDAATAPSPMNLTSMYWGWQGGYKYVRVEGSSTGQSSWVLHLGATGCTGDPRMGTRTCSARNEAHIALDGFDPARDVIVADLASMLATSDLDSDGGGAPGCMSGADDPECAVLFEAVGVTGSDQTFFRVEPRAE